MARQRVKRRWQVMSKHDEGWGDWPLNPAGPIAEFYASEADAWRAVREHGTEGNTYRVLPFREDGTSEKTVKVTQVRKATLE